MSAALLLELCRWFDSECHVSKTMENFWLSVSSGSYQANIVLLYCLLCRTVDICGHWYRGSAVESAAIWRTVWHCWLDEWNASTHITGDRRCPVEMRHGLHQANMRWQRMLFPVVVFLSLVIFRLELAHLNSLFDVCHWFEFLSLSLCVCVFFSCGGAANKVKHRVLCAESAV